MYYLPRKRLVAVCPGQAGSVIEERRTTCPLIKYACFFSSSESLDS